MLCQGRVSGTVVTIFIVKDCHVMSRTGVCALVRDQWRKFRFCRNDICLLKEGPAPRTELRHRQDTKKRAHNYSSHRQRTERKVTAFERSYNGYLQLLFIASCTSVRTCGGNTNILPIRTKHHQNESRQTM